MTVATRPSWKDPDGGNAYESGEGTSYAAPLVAGAAALLRRAAPRAPIEMIRRALEAGARMNLNLEGKVLDGSLDVACSLKWLTDHREPDWRMLPINAQVDPKGYADFAAATSGCGSRRPYIVSNRLELKKSALYTTRPTDSVGEFIKAIDPDQQADSVARQWQDLIIDGDDDRWNGGLTAFPVGTGGFLRPVSTAALAHLLKVYRAGLVYLTCGREGYVITGVSAVLPMIVRPSGWILPTNAKAPKSEIEFAVAFAKPWYSAAVDSTVTVRVSAICQFFRRYLGGGGHSVNFARCAWPNRPGGDREQLNARLDRNRGGIDHEVVEPRVTDIDVVEVAEIGQVGTVGLRQSGAGRGLVDPLEPDRLIDPPVDGTVEANAQHAGILLQHDRAGPTDDHAGAGGRVRIDHLFGGPQESVAGEIVADQRRRNARVRVGEAAQHPLQPARDDLLIMRDGLVDRDVEVFGHAEGDQAVHKRDLQFLGQGLADAGSPDPYEADSVTKVVISDRYR